MTSLLETPRLVEETEDLSRRLSAVEEVNLARRIEAGAYAEHLLSRDTIPEGLEVTVEELEWLVKDGAWARDRFVLSNIGLAKSEARKFARRGFSQADVEGDAILGLVRAVQRFDPMHGVKFGTYAMFWIRESIFRSLRTTEHISFPEGLWNAVVKVRAATLRLQEELGRTPTVVEVAEATDLAEKVVHRCQREDRLVISYDLPVEDGYTLRETLGDDRTSEAFATVEAVLDQSLLRAALDETLRVLEADDLAVLTSRYGLDGGGARSAAATARELGINRQTVRSRESRALSRLRLSTTSGPRLYSHL